MKRRPPATPQDLQRAVNMAAVESNQGVVARRLGIPRQTLFTWLERARRLNMTAGAPDTLPEWQQEKIALEDQVRDLKAQLASLHRDNVTAAYVRRHIMGIAEQAPEPPRWLVSARAPSSGSGVPCVMWSDWHWGEVVDPAQINGINEFNLQIAHKRARRLVERVIDLCKRHMVGTDYPGIVVNLGGDMVSGDIHDELTETNDLPTMPVLLDLYGVLIWALEALANEFGRVFVAGVPGNHGRNTIKPRFKNRNFSNFDWLLYCLLEKHFAGDKRLAFHIPDAADAYYSVMGHNFLLTHGDSLGTKGGDGIIGALGPILRGDTKVRISNTAIGQPYKTLIIGHWHQYLPLDRVIVNGTLKGYDEYAKLQLRAPPEPPSQALWFVHPRYGITCRWPIFLEEVTIEKKPDWVAWPKDAA